MNNDGHLIMFENVRIVLVNSSHPGNIGAAARAMKNMCLSRLYLVAPKKYPDDIATARASGADDILESAVVCQSLAEAIGDCHLVFGASARLRKVTWSTMNARECGHIITAEPKDKQIAILFGRENAGLTNEELDCCHHLVHIMGNTKYQSLNVAAAVQVVSYEVFMANQQSPLTINIKPTPVSVEEMSRFYTHLQETLLQIGFLNPDQPKLLMRKLKRLFNRAQPDQAEMNILRGILTETQISYKQKNES